VSLVVKGVEVRVLSSSSPPGTGREGGREGRKRPCERCRK